MTVRDLTRPGEFTPGYLDYHERWYEAGAARVATPPEVFVKYVRWRVSLLALALLPLAEAADVALYLLHLGRVRLARTCHRTFRLAYWVGRHYLRWAIAHLAYQVRVHRIRLWLLKRAALHRAERAARAARGPAHAALWAAERAVAEARARAEREFRVQRVRARLLRRGAVTHVHAWTGHPVRPVALSPVLRAALERHQAWVVSGWEVGKQAALDHADLHGTDLKGALLADADLHGANLRRADLSDADLEGADLHEARLPRARLRNALLRWADLRQADLRRADLQGADLTDADLHRANLRGARLGAARLDNADLRGANLAWARGLTQAQLDRVDADRQTRVPWGLKVRPRPVVPTISASAAATPVLTIPREAGSDAAVRVATALH